MTGPALAAAAGLGFGVFQTLNRRAVGGMADAYLATFLQLLIALGVLVVASVATEDVGLLGEATTASLVWFGAAGLVHFFVGWTLLNMSQMRIGAARTSPLLSTNPVFGAAIAAVWLSEFPGFLPWIGILLVLAGAFVVSFERVAETGWGVETPSQSIAGRSSGRHQGRRCPRRRGEFVPPSARSAQPRASG